MPDHGREAPAHDVVDTVDVGHGDVGVGVAHPHRRRQGRGEATEPGVLEVLRRAGLPGRGAADVGPPPRPLGDHAGEDVAVVVGHRLVDDPLPPGPVVVFDGGALRIADANHRRGWHPHPLVGEDAVGGGHLERGGLLGADAMTP